MAENKPSFLQNIGDDTESQDLLTALDGEPENEPTTEEPTEEIKTDEETVVEDKPTEDAGTVVEEKTGDEDKQDDDGGEESEKELEKPNDNKLESNSKSSNANNKERDKSGKDEPKIFGKYKTIEEAEKGYKELESTFGRVNAMLEGYKSGKIPANIPEGSAELLKMAETPMVKFQKPNVADYTDADGMLNVDAYMGEYTKNLVVGIQRSLLMGPLAAAQFGILQQAMNEEHGSRISAQKSEMEAEEITNKLYSQFPILKTDKSTEEIISNAIVGAKITRENQAKAKGETPVPFTYEDYEKIIVSILRNAPPTTTTNDNEKIEKMKTAPTIKGGGVGKIDEMDDILSGMEHAGAKGSIF